MIASVITLTLFGAALVGVLLEIAGTYHSTGEPSRNNYYRLVLFTVLGGLGWLYRSLM